MKSTLIWVGLCVMACGSSKPASRVVDGDESTLTDCKSVERVSGTGGNVDAAKNDARKRAAAVGATHIRWIVPCCTTVEGDAFRCDLPK